MKTLREALLIRTIPPTLAVDSPAIIQFVTVLTLTLYCTAISCFVNNVGSSARDIVESFEVVATSDTKGLSETQIKFLREVGFVKK